jgi:uncharacterized protein YjbI with pentapeptide repeats
MISAAASGGNVAALVRRLMPYAVLALFAGLLGLLIGLSIHGQPASPSLTGLSSARLHQLQLREQIRQLQITNAQDDSVLHSVLAWVPFATALAAIVTVGAALWKQASDLSAARADALEEQRKAREAEQHWRETFLEDRRRSLVQEEDASLRRFDSNLSQVIGNLGADSETLQVNAAAALATYIKPRYKAFHVDLLTVLTANLKLRPAESTARILRTDLERLLRLVFAHPEEYDHDLPGELDLARTTLSRLDVSGIDFGSVLVDVAFADLTQARLADAKLFRLRGREVILEGAYCSRARLQEARLDHANARGAVLHEANLVSATLKHADLRGAEFQRALMQEAQLRDATLYGANFTGANLANTYFQGAMFDEIALRSIARGAKRWRDNKNFDDATFSALLELGDRSDEPAQG